MIDSIVKYVQGIIKLRGATDNTQIGNVSDSLKTTVTSSTLPSGASTSALQTTGNTSLSSIDAKTPALINGRQPVEASAYAGTFTDKSGTATTASSMVAAANSTRKYFFIQNIDVVTIWIDFGVAAVSTSPSIRLQSGDSFTLEGTFISTQQINVIAASGSRSYVAKEGN